MFSLPTIREAIVTSHARVTGRGRDGTRKDRSTGWSPQTHSGHIVSCMSHSASRFHEINCAGRKWLSIVDCPHDFRRRPCKACHQLRHNLDIIVIIRLASWCNRSAACTVRSRPMCSSQNSGVRPSSRADSGAPIYSIIRGSCK